MKRSFKLWRLTFTQHGEGGICHFLKILIYKLSLLNAKQQQSYGKNGLFQRLIGWMLEQMLKKEMDEYLGYEKHSVEGRHSGNSRHRRIKKTLKSNEGEIELEVPRDCNCEF